MPTPIQVAAPVGTCIYNYGAFAFLRGTDQNLWVSWQNGANDAHWLKLGGPIGEGIAVLPSGPYMFAFVQNLPAKGLTCYWFNGLAWSALDLGVPAAGVTVVGTAGCTTSANNIFVFVRCSDGNLWTCWWNGAAWSWSNLGPPSASVSPIASVGTAVTPGGVGGNPVMYVFVQGSDNHLWTKWWNGAAWSWADLGVAMSAPVGAVFSGTFVYIFIKAPNGNLGCHWLNGPNWTYVDLGLPPGGVTLAEGFGASSYLGNPMAFFRGSDGRLWANVWGAGKWNWVNMDHPHYASVAGLVGLTTFKLVVGEMSDSDKATAGLGIAMGSGKVVAGAAQVAYSPNTLGGISNIAGGTNMIAQNANTLSKAKGTVINYLIIMVRGSDGHLWQSFTSDTESVWSDLGTVDWS